MGYEGARLIEGRGVQILIDGRVLSFSAVDMALVRDNDEFQTQAEQKYGRTLPIALTFTRDALSNVTMNTEKVQRGRAG